MQRAMPTNVGTWLGSFAQGWKDSTKMLDGAKLGSVGGKYANSKGKKRTVRRKGQAIGGVGRSRICENVLPWLTLSSFQRAQFNRSALRIGVLDQNPLGSAAGFGINGLQLDRAETANLLGFATVQSNPMQLGRA